MPAGQDLIFFIQDKQNNFWQLDASGQVVRNANPYTIDFSPDGWGDASIKNVRNKKYFAIDRAVSTPFKWVEDAAKILKYIFYILGTEERTYISICEQRLDYTPGVNYGYWYKQLIKCEVDFSTFEHDGATVTAAMVEEGFAKHLKANENTVFEIPLNVPEAVTIKEDGILVAQKATFLIAPIEDRTTGFAGNYWKDLAAVGFSFLNKEGLGTGIALFSQNQEQIDGDISKTEYMGVSSNYCAINTGTKPVDVRFRGTMKFFCEIQTLSVNYYADFNKQDGTTYPIFNNVVLVEGATFEQAFDITINLLPGEKIFLLDFFDNHGSGAHLAKIVYLETDPVQVNFETRKDPTFIKAHRPQYVFDYLIMKMSDNEYSAETCPYFSMLQNEKKVFTSGNGIRGFSDATLKISFSQFMSFWNTYDEVGIREKAKKILFDRKKGLVNQSHIVDLGFISNPKISFDKELPFNELAIGYGDVKNESGFVNGKNEFNTTFVFSLGTTKSPRRYEKISPVQASCYSIEAIRIETSDQDTADNRADNDPFVIDVERTITTGTGGDPDHYQLDRSLNPFLTGVDQASTIFNADLSPKRCALRSGDYLRSILYLSDNKILKFISADRNAAMVYVNGSDIVTEKGDMSVSDFAGKFLLPVNLSVETDAPVDLLDDIDSDPLLIYQFSCDAGTFRFISLENSVNPSANKKQTYTGWSTADNDLSKLIEYYG
jgi:hypothetical protein